LGITWDESYQRRWSIIRWGDYKYSKKKKTYRILPIAYWNTLDVWQYIEKYDLPWNKAYEYVDRVGCIVCTGFVGWEKQMAQVYPGLYKKIASDLGKPPLSIFTNLGD